MRMGGMAPVLVTMNRAPGARRFGLGQPVIQGSVRARWLALGHRLVGSSGATHRDEGWSDAGDPFGATVATPRTPDPWGSGWGDSGRTAGAFASRLSRMPIQSCVHRVPMVVRTRGLWHRLVPDGRRSLGPETDAVDGRPGSSLQVGVSSMAIVWHLHPVLCHRTPSRRRGLPPGDAPVAWMEAVRRLRGRFVAAARHAPVAPGAAAIQDTIAIVDGIRTRAVQSCLARAGDGLMGGAPKPLIGARGPEMARGALTMPGCGRGS